MVELRGVEPLSESTSTGTSPSADDHLHSLTQAWVVTLLGLVASLCMVRSKLCARTDATQSRLIRARGPAQSDGRFKQRRERRYRCSLIYKLPIFKMLGASARYSRFCAPVETSTAPRRDKLRILRFRPEGENSLAPLPLLSPSNPPGLGFDGGPGGGEEVRGEKERACAGDKLRILRFRPEDGKGRTEPVRIYARPRRALGPPGESGLNDQTFSGSGYSSPKVSTVTHLIRWSFLGRSVRTSRSA